MRLYARDRAWCSLDPDDGDHLKAFSDLIRSRSGISTRTKTSARSTAARTQSTLRVAMVFPKVGEGTAKGIPPSGPEAQKPKLPAASQFAKESVDIVLFPEGYIRADDDKRIAALRKLASKLDAALLVGAVDRTLASRRSHIAGAAPFRSRRIRSIPDLRKALQGGGRCLRERRLASEQGAPHHRAGRRARWGNDLQRSLSGPAPPPSRPGRSAALGQSELRHRD